MRQETFNVYRATQSVSQKYATELRRSKPIQVVALTHVKGARWTRDGLEYTLKPTNTRKTFLVHIKNKPYVLIASVLAGQMSLLD